MTSVPKGLALTLVDAAFRRGAALLTPEAPLQDLLDLAELALAAGERDGALLLFGAAALERGLSPEGLRWQAELAGRTGLWNAPALVASPATAISMVEQGLAELRSLLEVAPRLRMSGDAMKAPSAVEILPASRLASLSAELCRIVRDMLEAGSGADLAALSRMMREAARWSLSAEHRRLDGDLVTIAAATAYDRVRRLALKLQEVRALGWDDPLASVIGLSWTGLGPFFANVARLVRDGRDLPALLRGARQNRLEGEEEAAWLIALTITVPPYAAPEIARTLRSLGGGKALERLAGRARDHETRAWAWAVRDTALHAGDVAAATVAQRSLTRLTPGDWSEWVILGDLLGLRGDVAAAREAFARCQIIRRDAQVSGRIAALDAGSFTLATCSTGFFGGPARAQIVAKLLASR